MTQKLYFIILLVCAISCNGSEQPKVKRIGYGFPNTSVVNSIPQDCINKEDDKLINAGSSFESFLLNTVADKVSAEDENIYGHQFNSFFKKDMSFIKDNNLIRIQNILNKLTPYISRKDISYTISLVKDDSDVNAWTHVGGFIYVTTGLLKFINSDDELAFCIAHELGHNENEHCKATVQRIKTAENMGISFGTASMATNIYSSIFAAFNQPQEMEADIAGVYLVYQAGYDPIRSLDFFDKLSHNENADAIEKILRSHPFASERRFCLKTYLNNASK
jgi:predicted Zn-dependent protease